MRKYKLSIIIAIIIAIITAIFVLKSEQQKIIKESLLNSLIYSCDGGKTITAQLYEGEAASTTPGMPPTPGGIANIKLSDERNMTLRQTISADGVRYTNEDESFVFWSKGDSALVLENGAEKNYMNCAVKFQHISDSPKNGTYTINGEQITLVSGVSETEAAPGSASKITTKYFGNEAYGDINGDGVDDTAFILTQDTGGSGTFFYIVAAIKTSGGYSGTNAVLLGDRIAPQQTEIKNGEIIANYADRNPGEPMTTAPSLGVSKYLKYTSGSLVEIKK